MTESALFSSGTELASFVTSSVLLPRSWDVISHCKGTISTMGEGLLSWNVYKEPGSGLTIIAFEYPCTKEAPLVSFNNTAISLLRENYFELRNFISQMNLSTQLIVTGLGFGGFVATLFTTLLLDSNWLRTNRPLCITFGSPLIGNKKLQQDLSYWNFFFLHVVSLQDPLPRLSLASHSSSAAALTLQTSAYMPSGIFLFCSDVNSTCFENPESVLEVLKAMGPIHVQNQGFQYVDYGKIVENLYHKAIFKDHTTLPENMTHIELESNSELASSISLQLWALRLTPHMQNVDVNTLAKTVEELDQRFIYQRREKFDPSTKLKEVRTDMAQLELYKRESKNQGTGYYDSYKNTMPTWDKDVKTSVKRLTILWEKMVEEAEMKPRSLGTTFRTRWLYAGTNYRIMVEPLAIAQYYGEGGKDYATENRPKVFVLLEEWLRHVQSTGITSNVEDILDWDRYWDEYSDMDEDEDCYWHRIIDEKIASTQGSKVDQEEWNYEDKLNSYIRSDDEYVQEAISSSVPSTTSKNSDEKYVKVPFADKILRSTWKRNEELILTTDSCFWAHVEEACISCEALKVWLLVEKIHISRKALSVLVMEEKEETLRKLVKFEEYVYELLKKNEVSAEIFLPKSSYMRWWNEYKAIKGTSYDSELASFMNDERNYDQYALGHYDFLEIIRII